MCWLTIDDAAVTRGFSNNALAKEFNSGWLIHSFVEKSVGRRWIEILGSRKTWSSQFSLLPEFDTTVLDVGAALKRYAVTLNNDRRVPFPPIVRNSLQSVASSHLHLERYEKLDGGCI